jgi:AcrR family transcriptional regulator
MAIATGRPRISQDFIRQHQRERLITGLAHCIAEKGYRQTTVADVVAEAGVARNTFYDNCASKEDCARQLLRQVVPVLDVAEANLERGPYVLALEVAAKLRLGDSAGAATLVADAEQLLGRPVKVEPIEAVGADSPTLSKLPPGRHGLPREFVAENHRTRLLAGTARAVYEHGYSGATIIHICDSAAVSRRTFYEHFDGKDGAVASIIYRADVGRYAALILDLGIGSLWAEIVAAAFCGDQVAAGRLRGHGEAVLGIVGAQLHQTAEAA